MNNNTLPPNTRIRVTEYMDNRKTYTPEYTTESGVWQVWYGDDDNAIITFLSKSSAIQFILTNTIKSVTYIEA